jgi:acetyl esterase/lipase
MIASADYAQAVGVETGLPPDSLAGAALFCGPYDLTIPDYDGAFGGFLRTVAWAYSGRKDFLADPDFAKASVTQHVAPGFPPAFVSAGNGDPLLPHSRLLVEKLHAAGVPVDTLFFPADHAPALGHEYQFDLDGAAGRLALERLTAFLANVTAQ